MPIVEHVGSQEFFEVNFDYNPANGSLTYSSHPHRYRQPKHIPGAFVTDEWVTYKRNVGGPVRFHVGYIVLKRQYDIDPIRKVGLTEWHQVSPPDRYRRSYSPKIVFLDGDRSNMLLDNLAEGKNWRVRPNGDQWNAQVLRDGSFVTVGVFDDYVDAYSEAKLLGDSEVHLDHAAPIAEPTTRAERDLAEFLSNLRPSENIIALPEGRFRVRMSSKGKILTVGVFGSGCEARYARNLVHKHCKIDGMPFDKAVKAVRAATRSPRKYIDYRNGRWRARVRVDGALVTVGTFTCEDAAIMARDGVMNEGLSPFAAASKARAAFPDPEPTSATVKPRAKRFKQPKPRVADGVKYPRGWDRERAKAEGRAPVTSPVTAEPSLADLFNAS